MRLELVGDATPDMRNRHEWLGRQRRIDGERAVVVPQLEGAGLAQPIDRSPAAGDPDVDVAVVGHERVTLGGDERIGAADAAGDPQRAGRRLGQVQEFTNPLLLRAGVALREARVRATGPNGEHTSSGQEQAERTEQEDEELGHRRPIIRDK